MHKASITKLALSTVALCQHILLVVEAERRNSALERPRRDVHWQVDHDADMCVNQDAEQGLAEDVMTAASTVRCQKQRASLLQLGTNRHMQLPFDSGEDTKHGHDEQKTKVVVREASVSSKSASQVSHPPPANTAAHSTKESTSTRRNNTESAPLSAQQNPKDGKIGYPRGTVAAMMLVTEIVYKGAKSGVQYTPSLTMTVLVIVGAALILLSIVRMMRAEDDKHMTVVRRAAAPRPQVIMHRNPAPSHPVSPRTSYAPSMRQLGPTYSSQSIPMASSSDAYATSASPRPADSIIRATAPAAVSPRLHAPQQPREASQVLPLIASRHLCPGLVVPSGNECVLAVPTLRHISIPPRDRGSFNIQDLDGKSVIQAEVAAPTWMNIQASGIEQRPMIVLRAGLVPGSGGKAPAPLLAYCKAGQEAGERRNVYIYDARDELFAHICKDRNYSTRYVLTSGRIGLQLIFEGDFANRRVRVTNERQLLLSETESCRMSFDPAGSYYKLRVVADVDVGLMLCALIAIDHMELP